MKDKLIRYKRHIFQEKLGTHNSRYLTGSLTIILFWITVDSKFLNFKLLKEQLAWVRIYIYTLYTIHVLYDLHIL